MTFDPFLASPLVIQIHAATATIALVTGPLAIWRRKRDRMHKIVGYIWVVAMAVTALSAFFIHSFPVIGPFSPIHLLAALALWSLWFAMRAVFRGDIATHQHALRNLYLRGLLVATLFNFLPGRTVAESLIPERPEAGYVIITLGVALILGHAAYGIWRRRSRTSGQATPAPSGM